MPKFTFSTCYYIKNVWPNTYWFILSYSFQAFVWLRGLTMPSSSSMMIYRNRLGQFRNLNNRLESFWSHCLVISVQFLGHSGHSWVSAAPLSGHLDPLTVLLSFFRESKAVLASTIIFFENTSCFKIMQFFIRSWAYTPKLVFSKDSHPTLYVLGEGVGTPILWGRYRAVSLPRSFSLFPFSPFAGRSIESVSAWHASGPEFDPHVRHFRGDFVMKILLRPFSLFRWFKISSCQWVHINTKKHQNTRKHI